MKTSMLVLLIALAFVFGGVLGVQVSRRYGLQQEHAKEVQKVGLVSEKIVTVTNELALVDHALLSNLAEASLMQALHSAMEAGDSDKVTRFTMMRLMSLELSISAFLDENPSLSNASQAKETLQRLRTYLRSRTTAESKLGRQMTEEAMRANHDNRAQPTDTPAPGR